MPNYTKKRRGTFETLIDIIYGAKEITGRTNLMQKANLNSKRSTSLLNFLVETGFIEVIDPKRANEEWKIPIDHKNKNFYLITLKGQETLKRLDQPPIMELMECVA